MKTDATTSSLVVSITYHTLLSANRLYGKLPYFPIDLYV